MNDCFNIYLAKLFSHLFFFKFLQFYRILACRPLIICKQNILKQILSAFIAKKNKRNTYLWIVSCEISLIFWCCKARRLPLYVNLTGGHLVLLGGE